MSLSRPDAGDPYRTTGVKLGDEQFELASAWQERGQLALVGIGVEPGLSDVFARHAADELFGTIDEIGVRDGASLVVAGYDFAPTFSIWTTIEECLNPPVIWEAWFRGWFTTARSVSPRCSRSRLMIGPVECVNVEHEEVLLIRAGSTLKRAHVQVRPRRGVHRRCSRRCKLGLDATVW